ncbi:DNA adenine methylase [bacterium]|nr:DNA adenine methylase [bacterium]
MIKSPLRYPGGKSRAVDFLSALFPDFEEFREPFVGGGSIFCYLKQRFPKKQFWINDLYFELYNFWENSQNNLLPIVEQVLTWKNQFAEGKELYQFLLVNYKNFNLAQKASAFFIFNRITFSGTTEAGGYSEQAFKGRFTNSSIERLKEIEMVLTNTKITNLDYSELLGKEGKNVFIFLDPPYFSATKSALYGKNGNFHKTFDHERFAKNVENCKHKWLLTYDDSPFIRKLFSFANIQTWELTYGMRNVNHCSKQEANELLISNYIEKLPENNQLILFGKNLKATC